MPSKVATQRQAKDPTISEILDDENEKALNVKLEAYLAHMNVSLKVTTNGSGQYNIFNFQ